MNKKLIAVALAALPVAAMADVTLYGTLNAGFQNSKVTNGVSQNQVEDYTSFIGFKGKEDLGNGLKAIWQVETRIHADGTNGNSANGSNDGLGTRDTFVGLEGSFGKVRLGKLSNQLNDLSLVDPWAYNSSTRFVNDTGSVKNIAANGLGVFTSNATRMANAVRYDSPTIAGFDGSLLYAFGENKAKDVSGTHKSSDILGLGLNWSNDVFGIHYVYQKEMNPGSQPDDGRKSTATHHIEGSYNANNLFVALGYQKATGYDWNAEFSNWVVAPTQRVSKQAALTVAYTIGAITPRISYAKGWDQHDNKVGKLENSGYRQYIVGADYALSKRTSTGISYGNAKFGKGTTYATLSGNEWTETTFKTLGVHLTHSF